MDQTDEIGKLKKAQETSSALMQEFVKHKKEMLEFQQQATDEISRLRAELSAKDSLIKRMDVKVSKVEPLPDRVEILESQVKRLGQQMKNAERGLDADSPLGKETMGIRASYPCRRGLRLAYRATKPKQARRCRPTSSIR